MQQLKPILHNPFRRETPLRIAKIVDTLPEVPVTDRTVYVDREGIKSISPRHSISDEESESSSSYGAYPNVGNNADSEETEEPHAVEVVCPECEILRARIAELEARYGVVDS